MNNGIYWQWCIKLYWWSVIASWKMWHMLVNGYCLIEHVIIYIGMISSLKVFYKFKLWDAITCCILNVLLHRDMVYNHMYDATKDHVCLVSMFGLEPVKIFMLSNTIHFIVKFIHINIIWFATSFHSLTKESKLVSLNDEVQNYLKYDIQNWSK